MTLNRYWVAECDFGGVRCETQALIDSKLLRSEAHQLLERIGWRWAAERLACPPCAAEQQRIAGIEIQK